MRLARLGRYGKVLAAAALLALTGGCSADAEALAYDLLSALLDALQSALSTTTT